MKIGILTYHRAHNYGATLQAFALRKYLSSLGHSVSIVDYWPAYRNGMYDLIDLRFLRSNIRPSKKIKEAMKSMLKGILGFSRNKLRAIRFNKFIETELEVKGIAIENAKDLPDGMDAYIFGSDQIWRHNEFINFRGFDEVYWGSIPASRKASKIAYAASMGILKDDVESRKFIAKNIQNFDRISVREKNLSVLIAETSPTRPPVVLDPTFLLQKEDWEALAEPTYTISTPYVLLYNLNKSIEATQLAKAVANKAGCRIIEIKGGISPFEFNKAFEQTAGPREFLALIKNSEFVIASSFHGVVFSLIFEKQFYALGMKNNANRVTDLLSTLGISERYLHEVCEHANLPRIDYKAVQAKIKEERDSSIAFIHKSLMEAALKLN